MDPRSNVGTYVDPEDWNALVDDPDTLVIDTRNHYETAIGSFAGAIDPGTDSFRDFPQWAENELRPLVDGTAPKRIAMFCTGGIRCEKASSYLQQQGFGEVHHLRAAFSSTSSRFLRRTAAGGGMLRFRSAGGPQPPTGTGRAQPLPCLWPAAFTPATLGPQLRQRSAMRALRRTLHGCRPGTVRHAAATDGSAVVRFIQSI